MSRFIGWLTGLAFALGITFGSCLLLIAVGVNPTAALIFEMCVGFVSGIILPALGAELGEEFLG